MPNKNGKSTSVSLTEHAEQRINERFRVKNSEEIEKVLEQAAMRGRITDDGDGSYLIEHGCLVLVGSHEDGHFAVDTVFNLADGISEELKRRLDNVGPTPWESAEVRLSDGGEVIR